MTDHDPSEQMDKPDKAKSSGIGLWPILKWLLVFSVASTLLPLHFITTRIVEEQLLLEDDLLVLSARMDTPPTTDPEQEALQAQIDEQQAIIDSLQTRFEELQGDANQWPAVMMALLTYDMGRMTLTGLSQQDQALVLSGSAGDQEAIFAYIEFLQNAELFDSVNLQAIVRDEAATTDTEQLQFTLVIERQEPVNND